MKVWGVRKRKKGELEDHAMDEMQKRREEPLAGRCTQYRYGQNQDIQHTEEHRRERIHKSTEILLH
jgi:hypothetical protein